LAIFPRYFRPKNETMNDSPFEFRTTSDILLNKTGEIDFSGNGFGILISTGKMTVRYPNGFLHLI